MHIIGLTGGIASGKTTVANILKELGAFVLDADDVAKKVVRKGQPAYQEIIKVFGQEILCPDGELDRKLLGKIVFHSKTKRKILENIIHPRVKEFFKNEINRIRKEDKNRVIVLDVPLLLESKMEKFVDEIWVVSVSEDTQLKRVQARDGLESEEALQRIKAQMPLEEKKKYAHYIINTEGDLLETRRQVEILWNKIKCNEKN